MNERWFYTISQLYLVKYKIYNYFKIFFGIWPSGERKQSISRAILRAICKKIAFFSVPCFFLYNRSWINYA